MNTIGTGQKVFNKGVVHYRRSVPRKIRLFESVHNQRLFTIATCSLMEVLLYVMLVLVGIKICSESCTVQWVPVQDSKVILKKFGWFSRESILTMSYQSGLVRHVIVAERDDRWMSVLAVKYLISKTGQTLASVSKLANGNVLYW